MDKQVKQQKTELTILKMDEELGVAFGYAIVSKVENEDYYDLHGDHIPEDAMLKASCKFADEFMMEAREMHIDEYAGKILFAFPMTQEIAKSLDIKIKKSGLLIGMKPDKRMLKKIKDGEYKGFSIGFRYDPQKTIEVEDE